jgi:hypothetical protein
VLFSASAFARIGETEAQIETRYGKPIKMAGHYDGPGMAKMYEKAGLRIIVTFIEGISQSEYYSKPARAKLDSREVETILAANAGDKRWSQVKYGDALYKASSSRWTLGDYVAGLADDSVNGLLADFDDADGVLHISSSKFLNAVSVKVKADASAKLKDF